MCFTPNGVSPVDTGNQKQYPNPVEELSIKEPLSFPQKGIDLKHIGEKLKKHPDDWRDEQI